MKLSAVRRRKAIVPLVRQVATLAGLVPSDEHRPGQLLALVLSRYSWSC